MSARPIGRCLGHSIEAMAGGTSHLVAALYVDLIADRRPVLGEPYTRRLDGKLRELRFHLDGRAVRVTNWIAPGRTVLSTDE